MAKKILTQEDIDQNPILAELGYKAGDEIGVPSEETNANAKANNEGNEGGEPEDGEGDGEGGNGGGNNPGKKPPFTPEP